MAKVHVAMKAGVHDRTIYSDDGGKTIRIGCFHGTRYEAVKAINEKYLTRNGKEAVSQYIKKVDECFIGTDDPDEIKALFDKSLVWDNGKIYMSIPDVWRALAVADQLTIEMVETVFNNAAMVNTRDAMIQVLLDYSVHLDYVLNKGSHHNRILLAYKNPDYHHILIRDDDHRVRSAVHLVNDCYHSVAICPIHTSDEDMIPLEKHSRTLASIAAITNNAVVLDTMWNKKEPRYELAKGIIAFRGWGQLDPFTKKSPWVQSMMKVSQLVTRVRKGRELGQDSRNIPAFPNSSFDILEGIENIERIPDPLDLLQQMADALGHPDTQEKSE